MPRPYGSEVSTRAGSSFRNFCFGAFNALVIDLSIHSPMQVKQRPTTACTVPFWCSQWWTACLIPGSLVCESFNPLLQGGTRGMKRLAPGTLGSCALKIGFWSPRALLAVQVERRSAWRTSAFLAKDQSRSRLSLLDTRSPRLCEMTVSLDDHCLHR